MLDALQVAPDRASTHPMDPAPHPRTTPYRPEGIALLGIGNLHGVGFHTLLKLGRGDLRRLAETHDPALFNQAITEAGGRLPATAGDWDAFKCTFWRQGTRIASDLADAGVGLCFQGDPEYPKAFADLPLRSQPRWLFYRGNIGVLDRSCITVVGTRDPTKDGEFLARYSASCAREFNAPVVSGLAHGIDRVVHEWCLRLGLPTVSVLGTGILSPYPVRHAGLGEQIVRDGGLLVTEYLPQQGPSGQNFVWRNRLQAVLGRAVVPAE